MTTLTLPTLTRLHQSPPAMPGAPAGATRGDAPVHYPHPTSAGTEGIDAHRRILLVEDDPAVQDVLRIVLDDQGYAVTVCHSPAEAIAALATVAFGLVITDVFSRTVRDVLANTAPLLAAAGATRVALFTAHQVPLDAALEAGFGDVIAKPFDLETLERQVRTLLNT